jgi:two-component system phosphate regulon sensor histidine kinase PhoR
LGQEFTVAQSKRASDLHHTFGKTQRFNRFTIINGILIAGTAFYLLAYLLDYLLDGLLPDDGYWLVIGMALACFVLIQMLANRGHLQLAGRLWSVILAIMVAIQTVPFIEYYAIILFLGMQLVIIGAGSFAGRGWGYVAAALVTAFELAVVYTTAVDLSFGALMSIIICNAVIAAIVEHSELDRRKLAHTSDALRTVLDASPTGILLLGPDNRVQLSNTALWELYPEASRHSWADPTQFVPPSHHLSLRQAITEARETKQPQRLTCRSNNGELAIPQDIEVKVVPCSGDGSLLISIHDVTALRETERMKDAMIASVTHELNTPLTSLRIYHTLLERRPDKQSDYIGNLKRETMRLQHIIEEMLNMARLEHGSLKPQMEVLDLTDLVEKFTEDRRILAKTQEIVLLAPRCERPPLVEVDRLMVEQALGVLLNNAINYTPDGGRIEVGVRCPLTGPASVTVRDTGPGISEGELPHIFKRFYRGGAAERSGKPGTGLGLSIAQELIERHDGHITVESEPNTGTTFTIRLPLVAQQKEAAPQLGAASR